MSENRLDLVDFARAMARRGLREDALLILDLMPGAPALETLDLRARILTQLGRYAEAADLWRTVQEQCPEHQGAADGLKTVAALRKSLLRRLRLACALRCGRAVAVCLVLAAVALLALGGLRLAQILDGMATGAEVAALKAEIAAQSTTIRHDVSSIVDMQLRLSDRLDGTAKEIGKATAAAVGASADAHGKVIAEAHKETLLRISQAAAALKGEITAAKTETGKLKAAHDAAAKSAQEQTAAIQRQQKAAAEAMAKLADLSGASGEALGKSIQSLGGTLKGMGPALAALGEADGKQEAAIAALHKRLAEQLDALGGRIDTLVAADPGKKLDDLTAQYMQLRAGLSTQSKRTDELSARLKELGPQLDALARAAAALDKRLAAPPPAPAPAPGG